MIEVRIDKNIWIAAENTMRPIDNKIPIVRAFKNLSFWLKAEELKIFKINPPDFNSIPYKKRLFLFIV